ncbi:hypothetical protein KI688_011043 [Linnemannia hyalina]|uniref:Uncharacterized protein n=1 Tax=Linnemannia hyalina TaxID=64524 RepID=A0A9P7XYX8_9FUNG|nr:hypothetical protein KI688_011043 [Linnemannia hyalina]
MSHRSDIVTPTEATVHGSGAHEDSWSGHETDLHRQDFATMTSSSSLDDRNGRGDGAGWGFEFDIEAMKQSTGTRKKQQHRNGDYHSEDQRSIDGHGTDDDNWHTEGERSGTDSKAGFNPPSEVAWGDDCLDSNSQSHQRQDNCLRQEHLQRQQQHGRQAYQERQGHHERPSRHVAHRSPTSDHQRPGAINTSGWNSHHQWYSREAEVQESSNRNAGNRGDRKADDAEDDVWGLKRTERWTATEEDEAVDEKEEVVLDELTKYWAPSNILDLIRPNRSTQAFSDKHTRHGGQPYDGDNWGDAPEPTMTYNGEYTNTVLVEQRNKQYWELRDGEWILLNTSSGMMVTPQQKGINSAALEGDNGNGQSSEDESDNYSQGWSDYHPEVSSPTHSVNHESERKRYSGVYQGPAPPNSDSQEFLSEVRREISPEQFDLDAGFIPEDEWRKPLSARAKKHEEGEPGQMKDDQTGSWGPERTSWERPTSRASSYSESESVLDLPPDALPDFRTAKPGEPTIITRTNIPSSNSNRNSYNNKSNNSSNNDNSNNDNDNINSNNTTATTNNNNNNNNDSNNGSNNDSNSSSSARPPPPKKKDPAKAIESQPALLVDLDDNAATKSPPSHASMNMAQSLIGLDFIEGQDAQPPALDSTHDAATAETTRAGPKSADEDKQDKNEISTLVTIASESVDNTRNPAETASSKLEGTVDLLLTDIPAQELSKGESALDLLGINSTAQQSSKGDSLVELLGATTPTQRQPKDESALDIFATANAAQEPSKNEVAFDIFGASGPSQERSFKGPLPGGFLDLGSPYDWLNQIASRSMQQSEESRTTQKEQWSALMAKQEADSNRIQNFIQNATTDSASSTGASSKRGTKSKVPYSLAMAIETKDHGRQVLNVTERDDLKDMVERFCVQYDMQSYEMALWVTVAKAIKKKKKQLRESSMQQHQ